MRKDTKANNKLPALASFLGAFGSVGADWTVAAARSSSVRAVVANTFIVVT